jgi:hypothetical protein
LPVRQNAIVALKNWNKYPAGKVQTKIFIETHINHSLLESLLKPTGTTRLALQNLTGKESMINPLKSGENPSGINKQPAIFYSSG